MNNPTYNELITDRSLSVLKSVFKNERNSEHVRYLALMEYTAKFYNANNRALLPGYNTCQYNKTASSQGCAIGQHLTGPVPQEHNTKIITMLLNHCSWLIPSWMYSLDKYFLMSVQKLHDIPQHWDAKGITPYGKRYFEIHMNKWLNL